MTSPTPHTCFVTGCRGLAVFGFGPPLVFKQVWSCAAHRADAMKLGEKPEQERLL